MDSSHLRSLNAAQLDAVTHEPSVPLQILAGPGSGKTRVLTSRIAHLVRHHHHPPSSICAVTFTNKAASEMRHRLKALLGDNETSGLIMGTFHSICMRLLRRHGQRIGLANNFSVCDSDESKKIIAKLSKKHTSAIKTENDKKDSKGNQRKSSESKDTTAIDAISRAKSRGMTVEQVSLEAESGSDPLQRITALVYEEYEASLRKSNSLDFDDILLYAIKLIKDYPSAVEGLRHVLVDEFQDTSTTQYQLVSLFSKSCQALTIVGDPDQSIYGWRAAEIGNLPKMQKDFPTTRQIFLEENYRSTASVLNTAYAIMSQDKTRIAKGLFTSRANGATPVIKYCLQEHAEASFIADEIKRTICHSGGILQWNDFAVLLRNNALSRAIESAFQKEGIPMRMLAGQRFFERAEIKDVLAYLILVDNPKYDPAFLRIVNGPPRGIGSKSLMDIETLAKAKRWSQWETAEKICAGGVSAGGPTTTNNLRKHLNGFVAAIKSLRAMAKENATVSELIRYLTEQIHYERYLHKAHPDADSRWENVQELVNFAEEIAQGPTEQSADTRTDVDDDGETDLPFRGTSLRTFLEASSLSTSTEETESGEDETKVTVSTCHAAKGLEWPVVFIPAVENGCFPFYRTDDVNEERRLLYVACTRAKALLYVSHTQSRMLNGETRKKSVSEFLATVLKEHPGALTSMVPEVDDQLLKLLCDILKRPMPSAEAIEASIGTYQPTSTNELFVNPTSNSQSFSSSQGDRYRRETGFGSQRVAPAPKYSGPPPTFSNAMEIHKQGPSSQISLIQPKLSAPATQILPVVASTGNHSVVGPGGEANIATFFRRTTFDSQKGVDTVRAVPLGGEIQDKSSPAGIVGFKSQVASSQNGQIPVSMSSKENFAVLTLPATGKRRLGVRHAPDGFTSRPQKKARQDS